MRYWVIGVCCWLLAMIASAQPTYRTKELKRLAEIVGVDAKSLYEGYNYPTLGGTDLVVCVKDSSVIHVGLRLFAEDIRELDDSPIFNFLERYFLQLKYPPQQKTASNMIRDDEFKFEKGSIQSISRLLPTDEFHYNYNRHRYTAIWSRQGVELLSVSFPMEYELMSGENKIEAEDLLAHDIQAISVSGLDRRKGKISDDHYLSDDFSNRLYYKEGVKGAEETVGTKGELVSSSDHPIESAANMMLSQETDGDYSLCINQLSYGFKKTTFSVPLKQWIAFCQETGCELYFGVEGMEEEKEDGQMLDVVVLAVNKKENYNHVLTIRIPMEAIQHQQGELEARLYPYVPMHNVANMFASYRKSNKKMFVDK